MRSAWSLRGVRVGMLLAVFGLGYAVSIVAPGWVQAQPQGRNDWPAGELLRNGDLNRLVGRVRDLETRMNAPVLGAPTTLTDVSSSNNPATYDAVGFPSLVSLVPTGTGVNVVTFDANAGSTRVARVVTGGESALVVVPADQSLTVSANLGAGTPRIIVIRHPFNR